MLEKAVLQDLPMEIMFKLTNTSGMNVDLYPSHASASTLTGKKCKSLLIKPQDDIVPIYVQPTSQLADRCYSTNKNNITTGSYLSGHLLLAKVIEWNN